MNEKHLIQIKFVENMDKFTNDKLAEFLNISVSTVYNKLWSIRKVREKMAKDKILEKQIRDALIANHGCIKKTCKSLNLQESELNKYIWAYPENYKLIKNPFKKRNPPHKRPTKSHFKIDDNSLPRETNKLVIAKDRLGSRLVYDKTVGYKLDGQIVSTIKIMQVANLDDPSMYN